MTIHKQESTDTMGIQELIRDSSFTHSSRVAAISGLMAAALGWLPPEVSAITQAAQLHDVGKADIPPEILNKPGALTPEEYELVKTHTASGCRRIEDAIATLRIAATVCREHHERIDGKGGYIGLAGHEIHPYSKVVAIADVFDALYSKRVYKEPWDASDVCCFFREQAGKQFDAALVALLFALLPEILAMYGDSATGGAAKST